jgi:hypothetical protein
MRLTGCAEEDWRSGQEPQQKKPDSTERHQTKPKPNRRRGREKSLGNFGRTEPVLGTEATGGALSFMQELRRNEEKHFGKSNLGRMSSCPGENGMHIENWAERIPSVLGKTNRRRKNCAGKQVQ